MRIELLLFLSLMVMIILIIACSVPRRPTPGLPPTLFPTLALATYDPQIVTRVDGLVAVPATISPPRLHASDINISPPRCFRTAAPMLTCLGQVQNLGRKTISNIRLKASFSGADGEALGTRSFGLERRWLDAESSAPYRLFVPQAWASAAAMEIELLNARQSAPERVRLTLENESGSYLAEQKRYRYTAILRNDSGQMAREIRLLVTLENSEGALVGYRVMELVSDLANGAETALDLTIAIMGLDAPVRRRVSLEALPGDPALSIP